MNKSPENGTEHNNIKCISPPGFPPWRCDGKTQHRRLYPISAGTLTGYLENIITRWKIQIVVRYGFIFKCTPVFVDTQQYIRILSGVLPSKMRLCKLELKIILIIGDHQIFGHVVRTAYAVPIKSGLLHITRIEWFPAFYKN